MCPFYRQHVFNNKQALTLFDDKNYFCQPWFKKNLQTIALITIFAFFNEKKAPGKLVLQSQNLHRLDTNLYDITCSTNEIPKKYKIKAIIFFPDLIWGIYLRNCSVTLVFQTTKLNWA